MQLKDVLVGALRRGVSAAVGTLISSFVLLAILSVACAVGAYRIAGGGLDGTAAAMLALAAGAVGTVFGAIKRAIGHGVRGALEHAAVGSRVATGLLDRLVPSGDKLQLAEAERAVEGAVQAERRETVRGWLAGKIRGVALRIAEAVILVTMRESVRNDDGGVDVAKVRTIVAERSDGMILNRIDGMIRAATMIAFAIVAAGLIPAIAFRLSQ